MEIPAEVDNYIRESIEISVGLDISEKNMRLKILALQDARNILQNQVFLLEDRVLAAEQKTEKYKAEAGMNAQGLRKCIEEKERILSEYVTLVNEYVKMEQEHEMYECNLTKLVEACDELEMEKNELAEKLMENSSKVELTAQIENLKKEKETLVYNLNRAEEEVKVLSEENKILHKQNNYFLNQLKRNQTNTPFTPKERGKSITKKSTPKVQPVDLGLEIDLKEPFTPIHFNSSDLGAYSI